METIRVPAGGTCEIDVGDSGLKIQGPALIVCITEKDLEDTKPQKVQND